LNSIFVYKSRASQCEYIREVRGYKLSLYLIILLVHHQIKNKLKNIKQTF